MTGASWFTFASSACFIVPSFLFISSRFEFAIKVVPSKIGFGARRPGEVEPDIITTSTSNLQGRIADIQVLHPANTRFFVHTQDHLQRSRGFGGLVLTLLKYLRG